MKEKQTIFVLGKSESWCSAIRRNFGADNLSWVLDVESLIRESSSSLGAIAIVEFSPDELPGICRKLDCLFNNSVQLRLLAVGDSRIAFYKPLLNAAGFSATFCGFLEVPALVRAVRKHQSSATVKSQTIETQVWADLPWPTAASDRQA